MSRFVTASISLKHPFKLQPSHLSTALLLGLAGLCLVSSLHLLITRCGRASAMVGSARGFIFIAVLFVSCLLYATILMFPATVLLIPLVPRPVYRGARRAYRRWTGWVGYLFLAMAAYLLENFCNIKVRITGDRVTAGEAALIICNHRTRVDWMFLWCLCLRQGQLSGLKIVLKESLKGIPGFGWATQMLLYVFMARNKAKDVRRVRDISEYLVGLNAPVTLLIFPEGTDLSPSNHEKSLQFAKKEGLEEYQYLLHPKVRGFAECLRALRPRLEALHDVTIAYHNFDDSGPPSEKSMLAGRFPREVHMHVRRHDIKDLPTDDEGLQEWCREAFREKEARLKAFHEGPRVFENDEVQDDLVQTGRTGTGNDDDEEDEASTGLMALAFFLALVVLVLVCGGTVLAWYALTACCVCTIATAFGGWDTLELWWSDVLLHPSEELKQD